MSRPLSVGPARARSVSRRFRSLRAYAWIVLLGCGAAAVVSSTPAATAQLALPSGLTVNAEYLDGDRKLPALLVLHGFLQNAQFLRTQSVIDGLSTLGYPVLGPNLSLGIHNRRQTLQCEAVHKHTLAEDVAEIDAWVNWLRGKGHQSVIVIGQSFGSQHAVAYQSQHHHPAVAAIVTSSLARVETDMRKVATQVTAARAMSARRDTRLKTFEINYCRRFVGTAESYLSYAEWTDAKVLDAVAAIKVPVYAILGGRDKRVGEQWIADLENAGARVIVIPDANHFFSATHEFDLLDAIGTVLKQLGDIPAVQP